MKDNGTEYQLHWEGWADPLDLLEIAQVVRQEDEKLIGTVQFVRELFKDRIILHVELVGEEEFNLDPVEARVKAKKLIEALKKELPPMTKKSISRRGAFLSFPLINDLTPLRREIRTPAQLTNYLLPHVTTIMDTYFKDHVFHRTLIQPRRI
jgi:hypothetical protein